MLTKCDSLKVLICNYQTVNFVKTFSLFHFNFCSDSCNNAQVEYFHDQQCTVSAGTGPVKAINTECMVESAEFYFQAGCTSAALPPVFAASVVSTCVACISTILCTLMLNFVVSNLLFCIYVVGNILMMRAAPVQTMFIRSRHLPRTLVCHIPAMAR